MGQLTATAPHTGRLTGSQLSIYHAIYMYPLSLSTGVSIYSLHGSNVLLRDVRGAHAWRTLGPGGTFVNFSAKFEGRAQRAKFRESSAGLGRRRARNGLFYSHRLEFWWDSLSFVRAARSYSRRFGVRCQGACACIRPSSTSRMEKKRV